MADTFERVLTTRRPFDPRRGSETTWLYSIAMNCLRDAARRRGAEERAVEKVVAGALGPTPRGFDEELSDRDSLERALATLDPEEREAIALRFGADLTLAQIARVTGEKPTTAEGRVYRALRKLRAELEGP